MTEVYSCVDQLVADFSPDFSIDRLRVMPLPEAVLMCPPTYFDVVDVKNLFMEGQVGKVQKDRASDEWEALKVCFEKIGLKVFQIDPLESCEDMVFCANQTFLGIDAQGDKVCILSHMRHESRRREVDAFAEFFKKQGYLVEDIAPKDTLLEGAGDVLWHPGRGLIWGGYGHRTDLEVYPILAERFQVPVIALELKTDRFYHLDTCFCAVDEKTVIIYPPSFTEEGLGLIHHIFKNIIEVDESEGMKNMACNAATFFNKHVVIQRGSKKTSQALRELNLNVHEVDTKEYMKSGGSVFCMKMAMF